MSIMFKTALLVLILEIALIHIIIFTLSMNQCSSV